MRSCAQLPTTPRKASDEWSCCRDDSGILTGRWAAGPHLSRLTQRVMLFSCDIGGLGSRESKSHVDRAGQIRREGEGAGISQDSKCQTTDSPSSTDTCKVHLRGNMKAKSQLRRWKKMLFTKHTGHIHKIDMVVRVSMIYTYQEKRNIDSKENMNATRKMKNKKSPVQFD